MPCWGRDFDAVLSLRATVLYNYSRALPPYNQAIPMYLHKGESNVVLGST